MEEEIKKIFDEANPLKVISKEFIYNKINQGFQLTIIKTAFENQYLCVLFPNRDRRMLHQKSWVWSGFILDDLTIEKFRDIFEKDLLSGLILNKNNEYIGKLCQSILQKINASKKVDND